jgi:molybdopterin/thiamine biosynthesis adenylyltransferase
MNTSSKKPNPRRTSPEDRSPFTTTSTDDEPSAPTSVPSKVSPPITTQNTPSLNERRVLIVGAGGLGCATLRALASSTIGTFVLVDDDVVDETNLHRQILYADADVGRSKLDAARDALVGIGVPASRIELKFCRFLPENARQLVSDVDLVLEGADNYATKFLVADACYLERRPVVHGAAVGWNATIMGVGVSPPCYRCLFEDVPDKPGGNCDSIGVMGPVVGFAGALMADNALRILSGEPASGVVYTFEGRSARLRPVRVHARSTCALCGPDARIRAITEELYATPLLCG